MNIDQEIYINKRKISSYSPTYFIADIAANHDGDLERAKNLIYLAKEAGADCAKFQHFVAEKIVSDYGFKNLNTPQAHQATWSKSVFATYKEYECRKEWTQELFQTAQAVGIEFMTTPYDFDTLEEIDKFVHAYKIGSGDITWTNFIAHIAQFNKPVLLACGASNLDDIHRAVAEVTQKTTQLILMQCNTNYTAQLDNFKYINLNVLTSFKKLFPGLILGLSDHTPGHATVLGAVALGARVIEKHFTDDNSRVGPDHKFALNAPSWKNMVERTRELELSLGDGIKKIEQNEQETVIVQRRSIRLVHDIKKGHIITPEDIEMLRPAPLDAYPPYRIDEVINKKIISDKTQGDCIFLGELYD